ncbi:hypothetical protein [Liquorilactobacillus hordei]|uniref:hypothetical protein n=1 Tax=Liquorilactobacillus hordei TaxID=468911 RepID=UPI0039EB521B
MKHKYNIGDLVRINTTAKNPMNYLSGIIVEIITTESIGDDLVWYYKVRLPTSFGFYLETYEEENLIFLKESD